jgi:formate/nitrite transporter
MLYTFFMKAYQKIIGEKFCQSQGQLIARAILAGVILSFAGLISVIANATLHNPVVGSLLFSFGLVLIILLGAELFTSNCLVVLKPRQKGVISRLAVIYLFNLVGVVIITTFLWWAGSLDSYRENIAAAAEMKAGLSPVAMLFSGLIANFLVCIAAWLGAHEQGGVKLTGIIMPIMAFVMIKAEHSIANMFIFSAATLTSGVFEAAYLNNLLWVTIGNVVGGLLFALIIFFMHKK